MEQVATTNYWEGYIPEFKEGEKIIDSTNENQKPVKLVAKNDGGFFIVSKGKGRDAEDALRMAKGDQSKYMSAMMSRTIQTPDGKYIVPEDLLDGDLDEYLRLQAAFAEINF